MKPRFRVAITIALAVVLFTALLSGGKYIFSDASQPDNIDAKLSAIVFGKDTPVTVGQLGTISGSFIRPYTFTDAYKEAGVVADVIITEWLGEFDREYYGEATYFRAKILQTFKDNWGLKSDEIVLIQIGNSKWTYRGYPLFRNGERLLLCLSHSGDKELDAVYRLGDEDCFWIVCPQQTELLLFEKNGRMLVMKNTSGENFTDLVDIAEPDAADIMLEEFGLKADIFSPEEWAVVRPMYECVYSMDTLTKYMASLGKGD